MLKLILRQIARYRWPLILLAIFWIAGGLVIFPGRFDILSWLYRFTLGRPGIGLQNPRKAWFTHASTALERLDKNHIDLARMARACPKNTVQYYRFDEDFFRPDWLQMHMLKKTSEDQVLPSDIYWEQNRLDAIYALRHLVEATLFAYEIPADITEGRGAILVPEWVERVSNALCNPYPGLMSWGNYVKFQEERAYRVLMETEKDLEDRLPFPAERELLVLGTLRHRGEYVNALKKYGLGPAPSDHDSDHSSNSKKGEARESEYINALKKYGLGPVPADPHDPCRDFRLVCFSATEAAAVLDKLIYVSDADQLGLLYLSQARILRRLAPDEKGIDRVLDRFEGGTKDHTSEAPSRLEMGDILVSSGRYEEAYRQLAILGVILPRAQKDREFRTLARRVLMGTGHFDEADCFADESERGGRRPHCEDFHL